MSSLEDKQSSLQKIAHSEKRLYEMKLEVRRDRVEAEGLYLKRKSDTRGDIEYQLELMRERVRLTQAGSGHWSTHARSYSTREILNCAAGPEWRDALKAGIESGIIGGSDGRRSEVRNFAGEVRAEMIGGKKRITGYASVFNQLSEPLRIGDRTVRERVMPGAFDRSLAAGADIRALVNHDAAKVLARTASGTLRLGVDAHGLRYDLDAPRTSYSADLLESLERGDISQSSFGFYTNDDAYVPGDDGMMVRELRDVSLFEISPCTFPAYTGSSSGLRAADGGR